MDHEKTEVFEVKKKAYTPPEFKAYGVFSERTKSSGVGGEESDGVLYYTGDTS